MNILHCQSRTRGFNYILFCIVYGFFHRIVLVIYFSYLDNFRINIVALKSFSYLDNFRINIMHSLSYFSSLFFCVIILNFTRQSCYIFVSKSFLQHKALKLLFFFLKIWNSPILSYSCYFVIFVSTLALWLPSPWQYDTYSHNKFCLLWEYDFGSKVNP